MCAKPRPALPTDPKCQRNLRKPATSGRFPRRQRFLPPLASNFCFPRCRSTRHGATARQNSPNSNRARNRFSRVFLLRIQIHERPEASNPTSNGSFCRNHRSFPTSPTNPSRQHPIRSRSSRHFRKLINCSKGKGPRSALQQLADSFFSAFLCVLCYHLSSLFLLPPISPPRSCPSRRSLAASSASPCMVSRISMSPRRCSVGQSGSHQHPVFPSWTSRHRSFSSLSKLREKLRLRRREVRATILRRRNCPLLRVPPPSKESGAAISLRVTGAASRRNTSPIGAR